jgi:hypothetical protein
VKVEIRHRLIYYEKKDYFLSLL